MVGAGPAGLVAAKALAANGARVILMDRARSLGQKACGGGFTAETWGWLEMRPASPPVFAETHRGLSVHTPLGALTVASDNGAPTIMTVDRAAWQRTLLNEVRDLDVDVRLGERFVGIDGAVAVTARDRIRFDALVGADGASSRVRRCVGLRRGTAIKALQLTLPIRAIAAGGPDTIAPAVWFDPARMGTGYGWRFPFKDECRLGLGVPAGGRLRLRELFYRWLARLGVSPDAGTVQSGTIGCGYAGHRFGRVYLAGDAAGLASPLTGEGIYQALASGRAVADEIIRPAYRGSTIPDLAVRHRRTLSVLSRPGLAHLLSTAPWLLRIPSIQAAALKRYAGVCLENAPGWGAVDPFGRRRVTK